MTVLVVNFFGGPGSRKSTVAGNVFSELKWLNINCEYAQEYAKDKTWEKSHRILENQIKVFGEQHHRVWRLLDETDVVITDSPILLSIVYDKFKRESLKKLALEEFAKLNTLSYYLQRKAIYNPAGRSQTEEQAIELDKKIREMLIENSINFKFIDGTKDSVPIIVNDILNKLELDKLIDVL